MSSDRKASELLSKSFHGKLTADERLSLDESMADNSESAAFAKLSRMIQDSVVGVAKATEEGVGDVESGLSADAKDRMRKSVRRTQEESVAQEAMAATLLPTGTFAGDGRVTTSRFTLLRQIGQGGLGAVWLARDEDLKRTVAVKELLSDKADSPKHLQRFQREAMITGLLEHPNVVPLYMYGINSETAKPFYAMRFLGKQTLDDAISVYHARRHAGQAESVDLHRLLNVFLDVCHAIAYAHSRGVVHRDLKPDNVALDSFGQVIVLDWGIAKLLSDGELAIQASLSPSNSADGVLTNTMDGEVVGTPLYMAPEQALGQHDSVDERTDIFGLGALLYAILTGQPPHQATSRSSDSSDMTAVLQAIANSPIPMPREVDSQVSRDLEAICMRALNQHRFTRHGSAKELADDVERWMAGQHEKRNIYEALRLAGSSFRINLESCIRDFVNNARFVATLPPIMGLIDSSTGQDDEGEVVWRKRLSTIFRGMLRSNRDFQAVIYSQVSDDCKRELVRVEKWNAESQARSVPKSRLVGEPLDAFSNRVMQNKPDDVHITLDRNGKQSDCNAPMLMHAGVPVFDREEEPFGMVAVEGDFQRLLTQLMQGFDRTLARVLVIDSDDVVLIDPDDPELTGQPASAVLSTWENIKRALDRHEDFDDGVGEVYATRILLCPRASRSIKIVFVSR